MMEFKIGSKVEVLSKKAVIGMWRSAEIVALDGVEYTVKYDAFRGASRMGTFQRVSCELMRPYPPPTNNGIGWIAGDVVEVFDAGYWKAAMVLKVIREGKYRIRIIGAVEELEVQKSSLRARLAWEDNRWFVMVQDCQSIMQPEDDGALFEENTDVLPSIKPKRTPANGPSHVEGYARNFKRRKVSSLFHEPPRYSCPLNVEKVDATVYSHKKCSEKLFLSSSSIKMAAENAAGRDNKLGSGFHGAITDLKDSDATESSAGSCSIHSRSFNRSISHSSAKHIKDGDDDCSDAESRVSANHKEQNCLLPREVNTARVYTLESHDYGCTLQAYDRVLTPDSHVYRCTLKACDRVPASALHAYGYTLQKLFRSGPSLSWDQEVYLTDLRCSLKISNDEHLCVLKSLKSSGIAVQIR